ncbi:MAG: hypothetical protein FJ399_23260 [Verrucomicrobia bacterium]|nr:hypothetical protein [Verrucomicrobiota bacterium]
MTTPRTQALRMMRRTTVDVAPLVDRACERPDYRARVAAIRATELHAWALIVVAACLLAALVVAAWLVAA